MQFPKQHIVFRLLLGVLALEVLYFGYSIIRSTYSDHDVSVLSTTPPTVIHSAGATVTAASNAVATARATALATAAANPVAKKVAAAAAAPVRKVPVALTTYVDSAHFAYGGRWEHVTGRRDGRRNGTSTRSFHPGDRASFTFTGRFVVLFGVVGPGGGRGIVDIDGRGENVVDFHAFKKKAGELVFESPLLRSGTHHLSITVAPLDSSSAARNGYVNLDGAYFGT